MSIVTDQAEAAVAYKPDEEEMAKNNQATPRAAATVHAEGEANAAAATMTTKNVGYMLRSQNIIKEQNEEKDDEIRVLIAERRNIRKEDKEHMKNVSKMIKKCIRDKKEVKKTRIDSANTGKVSWSQEHLEHHICEEKNTHSKDKE